MSLCAGVRRPDSHALSDREWLARAEEALGDGALKLSMKLNDAGDARVRGRVASSAWRVDSDAL